MLVPCRVVGPVTRRELEFVRDTLPWNTFVFVNRDAPVTVRAPFSVVMPPTVSVLVLATYTHTHVRGDILYIYRE